MAMVLNEEQRPMCSSNSSGAGTRSSSSSKKNKQRKTPQRGMGVAQLEELRIREQQQKSGEASSSGLGLALPPAPQQISIPNPSLLSRESEDRSKFLNMLCNTNDLDVVARKYNLLSSSDSPNTSGWRPPVLPQRSQHQHQFLMANKILSPSSSSGVSLQIEPPSNQSYNSSNYQNIPPEPPSNQSYNSSNYYYIPPARPDEEKVAGVKRPWPFHPDSLTGYGGTIPCRVPVFRESSTSSSTTNHVDCRSYNNHNHGKSTADDGFLTLGSYAVPSISRSKHPFSPSHLPDYPTTLDFPSSQVSREDGLSQSRVSSERLPFYSFLPVRPDSHETTSNERHGEALDTVDLNLKL